MKNARSDSCALYDCALRLRDDGTGGTGADRRRGAVVPFMAAAMLASLSVLPIVILPRVTPHVERVEPLKPLELLRMTPVA